MNTVTFFFDAKDAFVSHNTDAPVVAVKAWERGYYPIYTRAKPDALNHDKYTPEILEAALAASMFGWNTPAASPAAKFVEAEEKRQATEAN